MPLVIRQLLRQANTIYDTANTALQNGVDTIVATGSFVDGYGISVRDHPINYVSPGYTLELDDAGSLVVLEGADEVPTITLPADIHTPGQIIRVYNSSLTANIQVVPDSISGVILYTPNSVVGVANTGQRNVAAAGMATITCVDLNTYVISGTGVNSFQG